MRSRFLPASLVQGPRIPDALVSPSRETQELSGEAAWASPERKALPLHLDAEALGRLFVLTSVLHPQHGKPGRLEL